MIKVTVARLADLPPGTLRKVAAAGREVLLVRSDAGEVRAFGTKCPHAGAPLEKAALCGDRLVCPWHKGCLSSDTGAILEPPPLEALRRYPLEIVDGEVNVDFSRGLQEARAPGDGPVAPHRAETFVILGGGPAGASAAQHLRALGFAGRLLMVSREERKPYDRTLLSKMYLSRQAGPEKLPLRPENFYPENRVEWVNGAVVSMDAVRRELTFADGVPPVRYDRLLLATGGTPKKVEVPGAQPAPLLLRSVEDADAISAACDSARHVVLIGSSFIAMEVASALRERDLEVTVVAREKVPFSKQLGPEMGKLLLDKHLSRGVRFQAERKISRARPVGRQQILELDNGETLVADVLVSGVGVAPGTDYVRGVDLAPDGGVSVDDRLRVLGLDGVYAAGDIAVFPLPRSGQRVRIEHWRVAQEHGRVAAANMLGLDRPYDGLPYFWTYHYGVRYEYLGHPAEWDDVEVDGNPQADDFAAFYVKDGRCVGAFSANRETGTGRLFDRLQRAGPPTVGEAKALVAG